MSKAKAARFFDVRHSAGVFQAQGFKVRAVPNTIDEVEVVAWSMARGWEEALVIATFPTPDGDTFARERAEGYARALQLEAEAPRQVRAGFRAAANVARARTYQAFNAKGEAVRVTIPEAR